MKAPRNWARRMRFFVLEKLLLPIAIVPLRALVWSWRTHGPDQAVIEDARTARRLILVTYHGMLLHLLAYSGLTRANGRRLVVLLTPSLDGRLLAALLRRFGIDYIAVAPGKRAIAGVLDFAARLDADGVGLIAVDGPRGPPYVVQPHALEIAGSIGAEIFPVITTANHGLRFGSWDGAHLPLPFAKTEIRMWRFSSRDAEARLMDCKQLQDQ